MEKCADGYMISSAVSAVSVFSVFVSEKLYITNSLSLLKLNRKMVFRGSLWLYSKQVPEHQNSM